MGWTGSILNGVGGFTTVARDGNGDLQLALGRTTTSKLKLIADIADDGISPANSINVMAKYKSFICPNFLFADAASRNAARAAARYGMSEPSYFYPSSLLIPGPWIYDKPVAGTNPLRAEDFVKDRTTVGAGYDPHAVPPLAMEVSGGLKCAATFTTMLWKDGYVNNYLAGRSDDKWWDDRSLSIAELLGGGLNSYYGYWIAFVFYRYDSAGASIENATLVVTNKKFGDVSGVGTFQFYPQGDGTQSGDYIDQQGIHYPVIPTLQTATYVGRKFAVVACLSSTGPSDPISYAYQVLPNNYPCIPLSFDANHRWDYAIETASSEKAIDLLTGVFNSGPVLTFIRQHEGGWNEYSCAAWITADITSQENWSGTSANVHISASAQYGMFGAAPGQPGSYGEYTADMNISVPSGGHTTTQQLVQLPNVFIYKDGAHEVVVSAKFTQNGGEKAFNNTLTISD